MKKVSVIMPAKNEEKYIAISIESILEQSFKDFEFLILDDMSTDKTKEIIQKYKKLDSRIKLYTGPGKGVGYARNILYKQAKGEYIVNADADDYSKKERIETLLEKAEEIGHPVMVGSNFDIYKDGKFLRTEKFPTNHKEIKYRLNSTFNRYSISAGQILGSAYLFKKYPVNTKYKIMSDWDQFLRIQENENVILANISKSLYIYRINNGSMTRQKLKRSLYSAFLRENERLRKNNIKEFDSIDEYILKFWKNPKSLFINSFFILAKYFQQLKEY